ncbi:MAG: radical SAM protein [Holophagaceae bacterium]|nr:radical SAM protein [Holophagaceae bacterium]
MTHALLSLDAMPIRLFRDFQVEPEEAKSILRPQKDARYGWGFSLNPYRGCSHGCRYCYVRGYPAPLAGQEESGHLAEANPSARAKGLHDPQEWGRWVTPKLNAPELLWAQRHKLHNESVFISSATDPYQPIERNFRLTRKCLQVLLACPTTQVILHTRSPMVLQDLELLKAFGGRLSVGFSIPTDDDAVRQIVEPDAPSIPSRWGAVEQLSKAGIPVTIGATPLLAVRDIAGFAGRVRDSGARSAWVGGLRLLKDDPFYSLLAAHRWLHILEPAYREQVRQAFKEALCRRTGAAPVRSGSRPGKSRSRGPQRLMPEPVWATGARISAPTRFVPGQQPSLFTQAS